MKHYNKFKFTCAHCGEVYEMELDGKDLVLYQAGMLSIDDFEYLDQYERDMVSANMCFSCLKNFFGTDEC